MTRAIALAVAMAALAADAGAQWIVVETTADGSGGPACTLRDAIAAANLGGNVGGCDLPDEEWQACCTRMVDLTGLGGTIDLYEMLVIDSEYDVHVLGPGADRLAIRAAATNASAFLNRGSGQTVITGLTIRDAPDTCVRNERSLVLRDARLTGCHADTGGAAVDSGDPTSSERSYTLLDRCLVDGNTGSLAIRIGGASTSVVHIQNTTVSGNEGGVSIDVEGPMTEWWHSIRMATLAENGPVNLHLGPEERIEISHTILKRADANGVDCAFDPTPTSPGDPYPVLAQATIADDASCGIGYGFNQEGVDPEIGPLAANGGPTFTHALLPGSPAIDVAGAFPGCLTVLGTDGSLDQRGRPRPVAATPNGEARCDAGAFELPEGDGRLAALAALWAVVAGRRTRTRREAP